LGSRTVIGRKHPFEIVSKTPYKLGVTKRPQFSPSHDIACFPDRKGAEDWAKKKTMANCPRPFVFAIQGVWYSGEEPKPNSAGRLYPHQIGGTGADATYINYVSIVGGFAMYMNHAIGAAEKTPVVVEICDASKFTLPKIEHLDAKMWCVSWCEPEDKTTNKGGY
jgi:hypothetical protein